MTPAESWAFINATILLAFAGLGLGYCGWQGIKGLWRRLT